jgi:hypothetical protein
LIFFKRPNDQFRLNITLDKQVYAAGDQVNYIIRVLNATTGAVFTGDTYVTVSAVDVLGYTRPNGDLGLPAPLSTRLHLSQEIRNFDNERVNSLSGLNSAIQGNDTRYIDLLFGLQSWRQGLFDVRSLVNLNSNIANLAQADVQAIQGLYNFVLSRTAPRAATNVTANTTASNTTNATNTSTGANSTNNTNNTKPANATNGTVTNGTNVTTNGTTGGNNTNNTNNATNNTNNTVPAVVITTSVRSGVLANEADPVDYMQ